jgi:hypothetical protein
MPSVDACRALVFAAAAEAPGAPEADALPGITLPPEAVSGVNSADGLPSAPLACGAFDCAGAPFSFA